MKHFTFLFYVLQNTQHKKKDGTIFVDPSPYTINLLIAYDENTFAEQKKQYKWRRRRKKFWARCKNTAFYPTPGKHLKIQLGKLTPPHRPKFPAKIWGGGGSLTPPPPPTGPKNTLVLLRHCHATNSSRQPTVEVFISLSVRFFPPHLSPFSFSCSRFAKRKKPEK